MFDLSRKSVTVPYRLLAWPGVGNRPASLVELADAAGSSDVQVIRGWALSNVRVSWRGLVGRELRKSQLVVWWLNESASILEGGIVDTIVTDQINALLSFAKDFELDQNAIDLNVPAYQQSGLMTDTLTPSGRK